MSQNALQKVLWSKLEPQASDLKLLQAQELCQWLRLRLWSQSRQAATVAAASRQLNAFLNLNHHNGRSKSRNLQIFDIPLCSYSRASSLW